MASRACPPTSSRISAASRIFTPACRGSPMTYPSHLIPTTVVGSYPQPDWLVDRTALAHHGVPRVAAGDIWRIAQPWLEAAQDDATVLAIGEMERAGIDIVSDGEIRRESY